MRQPLSQGHARGLERAHAVGRAQRQPEQPGGGRWFGARADLQKTFPQSLSYLSWELVPGQTIRVPSSAIGSPRVAAVLVFANYTTPGANRVRVEDLKGAVVARFDIQSFDVSTTR